MRYVPRGLLISASILLGIGLSLQGVFAQVSSNYDCADMAADDYLLYPTSVKNAASNIYDKELTVFTDKDLQTALVHLQSYCCEIGQIATDTCIEKGLPLEDKLYTESPYLGDHLMYVGMKKLDGNQDHCDELDIDCQPESFDVDPVERRDEINEIAEDTKGYPPSIIHQKFIESRGESKDLVFEEPYTMTKAYRAMCNDIGVISKVSGESGGVTTLLVSGSQSLEELCFNRAQQRYIQEAQYIRLLMNDKGRTYFIDNISAYVNNYFIDSRLQGLMGKYATLDGCFASVLRYVQKTSCCNE